MAHGAGRRKRRRRSKRTRKAFLRFAGLAFAVVAIGAILLVANRRFESGNSIEAAPRPLAASFRLPVTFDPAYAGDILAARAELFRRSGLAMDLKDGQGSADPIAAVVSGAETFGAAPAEDFLTARAKGAPIVAFGAGYLESPIAFFALESAGIHGPRDFVGKRVLREANGRTSAMIYDVLLQVVGLGRSEPREVAGVASVDALANGDVDVIPGRIAETSYALSWKGVRYTVISASNYGIHVPGTAYFAAEKTIRDDPSTVQRFLNGIIAGWMQVYADYSKSVPLLVGDDRTLSPDQVRFELAAQRDYVIPAARRIAEFDDIQWKQLAIVLNNERVVNDVIDLSRAINYDVLKETYRRPISFGK